MGPELKEAALYNAISLSSLPVEPVKAIRIALKDAVKVNQRSFPTPGFCGESVPVAKLTDIAF